MKKTNFLKILMTLVMAFVISAVYAQYQPQDAVAPLYESVDSVTLGVQVPYFVEPDAYFNPAWAGGATGADVGNVVSSFVWAAPTVPGGGTATAANANANYIEYTFTGATGTYGLSVTETASGCPGTAVTMNVEVINEPTNAFTNGAGFIDANLTECEGSAALADAVQVTFTTDVRAPYSIQLDWTLEIKTLTSGGADDKWWDDTNLATAPAQLGANAFAEDHRESLSLQTTGLNALTYDPLKPGDGFVAINDGGKKTTVYTYTVTGVNDRISRKSDYLTNSGAAADQWSWYGTTESVVITVNPAPVTGPIYHISNIWAN